MIFFADDLAEVKDYLGIEHEDDNALLAELVVEAEGRLVRFLKPNVIVQGELTEQFDGGVQRFVLSRHPVVVGQSEATPPIDDPVVTDLTTGEAIDPGYYALDARRGILVAQTGVGGHPAWWARGVQRWQVTYTGGLDVSPEWTDVESSDLRRSIVQLVALWYNDREAQQAATPESIEDVWKGYQG